MVDLEPNYRASRDGKNLTTSWCLFKRKVWIHTIYTI